MNLKRCQSCQEDINIAASKCPNCMAPQSSLARIWLVVIPALCLVPMLLVLIPLADLWRPSFNGKTHRMPVTKVSLVPSSPPRVDEPRPIRTYYDGEGRFATDDLTRGYRTIPGDSTRAFAPKTNKAVRAKRTVWVYCTIHNKTNYRWRNISLLVEFQDSNGKRIDLDNVVTQVTIQPQSSLDCRVECKMIEDPNNVAKTRVSVTNAARPLR